MKPDEADHSDAEPAADYTVGYGRPPVATRFRPGQSGNPRGSRKGARDVGTILAAVLAERVAVKEDGRRSRNVSKLEQTLRQLVDRAAGGDPRATQSLLALVQAHEAKIEPIDPFDTEADAAVIAGLMRRLTGRP